MCSIIGAEDYEVPQDEFMKAGEIEDDFFLGGGSACTENKVFYNNLNEKSGALLKKLSAAESLGNGFSADMTKTSRIFLTVPTPLTDIFSIARKLCL